DIMSGIEYIHTREPPICHGDLKSLNILVDSECCAVLTDFGSARVLKDRTAVGNEDSRISHRLPVESILREDDQVSPQIT
ncbi:hypothetical protein M407DRAFT_49917, partial [Tulasnella calospora MUT 4182]